MPSRSKKSFFAGSGDLEGGSGKCSSLACVFIRATPRKSFDILALYKSDYYYYKNGQLFPGKKCTPEKILATPMNVSGS